MEVLQQVKIEVDKTKEVMYHFKEDLEEVVEEALLKRRSTTTTRTTSDGSTLTTVSSTSSTSESESTSNGDVPAELDASKIDESFKEEPRNDEKPQGDSVYLDKNEGTGVDDLAAELNDGYVQQVLSAVINGQQVENLPGPSKKEPETAATIELEESDEEVVELEFQTAVEKMHTHNDYNMYCPNCSNRITKVVLRRKIRQRRIPVQSDNERRDLFGCLSCFRIFVSSGNRLNPFRIFGAGRDHEENIQLHQEQLASDVTVPTSGSAQAAGKGFDLFWFFRKRRDEENASTSPLLTAASIQSSSIAVTSTAAEIQPSSTTVTSKPGDEVIEQRKGFDLFWFFGKGRHNENALTSPLLTAEGGQSSSTTVISEPRGEGIEKGPSANQQTEDKNNVKTGLSGVSTRTSAYQSDIAAVAIGKQTVGKDLRSAPPQESILNGSVIIDMHNKHEILFEWMKEPMQPELEIKGATNTYYQQEVVDEVKIPVVETPRETGIPQPADTAAGATRPLIVTESGSSRSLEIVKSVVYGGLMESMASLSVVSSAAASDATTLNIVVLGLANLVGGLVVLAHNLRDLRFGDSNQTNEERYKEELGRKEHFLLHATVAVLSYIIFGLIPPVTYGFTFRETNDRDFTMLAVAAASFLCIVILAIAKAHTRGQHRFTTYFKTVLYYVTSAVMVSGVAFAVGDLVEKLLERLGWLDPATVEPKSFQSTWASY